MNVPIHWWGVETLQYKWLGTVNKENIILSVLYWMWLAWWDDIALIHNFNCTFYTPDKIFMWRISSLNCKVMLLCNDILSKLRCIRPFQKLLQLRQLDRRIYRFCNACWTKHFLQRVLNQKCPSIQTSRHPNLKTDYNVTLSRYLDGPESDMASFPP